MKKVYLKQLYNFDEEHQRYVLELALDEYLELFNPWDAAPMKKKSLDPELVNFLEDASEDIPLKEEIEIVFILPKIEYDLDIESTSRKVFINYFNFLVHLINRELQKFLKQSLTYILFGFSFLLMSYYLEKLTTGVTLEIVSQGLFIGGWVFIWESFSLFFFKSRNQNLKKKWYLRLLNCPINFKYHGTDTSSSIK